MNQIKLILNLTKFKINQIKNTRSRLKAALYAIKPKHKLMI